MRWVLLFFISRAQGTGEGRPLLNSFANFMPGEVLADLIALKQRNFQSVKNKKSGHENVPLPYLPPSSLIKDHVKEPKLQNSDVCHRNEGVCDVGSLIDADIICPSGCQLSSRTTLTCECIAEGFLEEACDPGFVGERQIDGNKGKSRLLCVKSVQAPPSLICRESNAHVENGKCMETHIKTATPICPGPSWKVSRDMCVKEETLSPQMDCPAGFYKASRSSVMSTSSPLRWLVSKSLKNRRIPMETSAADSGDLCVSQKGSRPIPRCPAGSRMDNVKNEPTCLKDLYELPTTECPVGFQQDKDRIGVCRKELHTLPEKVCPNLYSAVKIFRNLEEVDRYTHATALPQQSNTIPAVLFLSKASESPELGASADATMQMGHEAPHMALTDSFPVHNSSMTTEDLSKVVAADAGLASDTASLSSSHVAVKSPVKVNFHRSKTEQERSVPVSTQNVVRVRNGDDQASYVSGAHGNYTTKKRNRGSPSGELPTISTRVFRNLSNTSPSSDRSTHSQSQAFYGSGVNRSLEILHTELLQNYSATQIKKQDILNEKMLTAVSADHEDIRVPSGALDTLYPLPTKTVQRMHHTANSVEDGATLTRTVNAIDHKQPQNLEFDHNISKSMIYWNEEYECQLRTVKSPRPTCRDGFEYSLKEVSCVKVLKEEPIMKCPTNFTFDGKTCVHIERSVFDLTCPQGSIRRGSSCISAEIIPGIPSCPKQYKYEAGLGHCVGSEETQIQTDCPVGMALNVNSSTCVDTTTIEIRPGCPDGYILEASKNLCIREQIEQPIWDCSMAYEESLSTVTPPLLMGNECYSTRYIAPEEVCPADFERGADGMCHSTDIRPLIKKCPSGFVLYDGKCLRHFTLGGKYECPDGTSRAPQDESKCVT